MSTAATTRLARVRRGSLAVLALIVAEYAIGMYVLAAIMGAGFTSSGQRAESMGMSVLTGVALLCYAASLYVPRSSRRA